MYLQYGRLHMSASNQAPKKRDLEGIACACAKIPRKLGNLDTVVVNHKLPKNQYWVVSWLYPKHFLNVYACTSQAPFHWGLVRG